MHGGSRIFGCCLYGCDYFLGIGFLAERILEGFQTHLFLGPVEIHHFLDMALVFYCC